MNKALSFVRLDFVTVKPYFTLKNFAIIIVAPLIILISTGVSTMTVGMFVIIAVLYVNYPFAVCEKNGMDALYPTLSINRRTVVLGRYLFALAFDLCAALMGLVLTFVPLSVMQKTVNVGEMMLTLLATFAVVSLIEAVQLPIYFKLGYSKAKVVAYLPFIGFWLAAMAVNRFLPEVGSLPEEISGFFGWFASNPYIAVLFGIIIWFGLMLISYQKSLSYYSKRDF